MIVIGILLDWFARWLVFNPNCSSCWEKMPLSECPASRWSCGHHCNHSWSHDECEWCNEVFEEVLS